MSAGTAIAERKQSGRWLTALLLAPSAVWFLVLLILPLIVVVVYSVGVRAPAGGYEAAFTFDNYLNLPARWAAFRNTLTLAPAGTLICLLAGYPLAYFLAVKAGSKWRVMLLILVIVPFWTSFLIRTYAWIFILGGKGIPALLGWAGFPELRLINTPFAVLMGIVYGYLPLMVFPIYVSLEKLDKRLLEASADLGARAGRTFRAVVLPTLVPSIFAGSIFTFSLSLGDYITVQIVGGKTQLIGNLVYANIGAANNLPFAAAIACVPVLIMVIYLLAVRRSGALEEL